MILGVFRTLTDHDFIISENVLTDKNVAAGVTLKSEFKNCNYQTSFRNIERTLFGPFPGDDIIKRNHSCITCLTVMAVKCGLKVLILSMVRTLTVLDFIIL